ncbi:S-layer homology domain-containing protein, partial [Sedimentibacter sp.]|uniref:S-layer homology domain-containing protein n=1 Tax=Sedimentibacter sp. TaxID=1960295 RepID=UPI002896C977
DPEPSATVTGNVTYTAQWEQDSNEWHTVKFIAGPNGSIDGKAEFDEILTGTVWGVAVPTVPTPVADVGYKFVGWTPSTFAETVTENLLYTANFEENENITIYYEAGTGGTVSRASESLSPVTGIAQGSTANADDGYYFVNWTDEQGKVVSTNENFVPQKVNGLNVPATYTANFNRIPDVDGADYYVVFWNYDDVERYRLPDEGEATVAEVSAALGGKTITIQNFVELHDDDGYVNNPGKTTVKTIKNPVTTGSGITGSAITFTKVIKLYYDSVPVERKQIIATANSGSYVYNGTERTVEGYTVKGLLEGDELIGITAIGKGTNVGTYDVVFTGEPRIIRGSEVDVTDEYDITFVNGKLTITSGGGGGGGGGTPVTTIEEPEIPLADLEKVDHFAYVIGYPDGEVKPMGKITREEVAMIFYRLLTDESRDGWLSDANPFTDLAGHDWSNRAISTLYNAGIIKGYPDGTFRPSDPITRAEFATIAAKFDALELQNTTKFTDIFGHWAEKYITSSENKGWIKGYPDMTFKPEQDITRAEAMTLINNVLERAVPAENIHPDAIFWPDMQESDWYYEAVMEATNSHDYVYEEDGDELWTGMKANKVWP